MLIKRGRHPLKEGDTLSDQSPVPIHRKGVLWHHHPCKGFLCPERGFPLKGFTWAVFPLLFFSFPSLFLSFSSFFLSSLPFSFSFFPFFLSSLPFSFSFSSRFRAYFGLLDGGVQLDLFWTYFGFLDGGADVMLSFLNLPLWICSLKEGDTL